MINSPIEPAKDRCACHGKTEEEIARPYALFVFGLAALILVVLSATVVATW